MSIGNSLLDERGSDNVNTFEMDSDEFIALPSQCSNISIVHVLQVDCMIVFSFD